MADLPTIGGFVGGAGYVRSPRRVCAPLSPEFLRCDAAIHSPCRARKISAIAASLTYCMPVADMRHAVVCYTCETGLVAGTIGYRPDPVDAPVDRNVVVCCSQPAGDVVIDL